MLCNPELLGALADGELGGVRAWRLRRHLAHCKACQQELAALEALGAELKRIAPLPSRQPVRRPLGLVRPALVTLAMASAGLVLVRLQPATTPEVSPQVREMRVQVPVVAPPAPKAPAQPTQVALSTEKVALRARRVALRHKRVTRRTVRVRRHAEEAAPEQIIVVTSRPTPPQPVTVVLNDKDDEGGTIHIESTIPAAYVVALQKEKL